MNSVYLGNGIALTKTTDSRKLFLPTDDISIVPHLLLGDPWEAWITDLVKKEVQPGQVVVEVGACVGWYTTLFGKLVGATGHVHAFEAVDALAGLCQRSIEINGLAEVVTMNAVGVWEVDGYKTITVCQRHRGESSFGTTAMRKDEPVETLDVPVTSLQTYFGPDPRPRPTFIKIDAEGAEAAILRGAGSLLESARRMHLLVEWNPRMLRACGEEPESFLRWLTGRGFLLREVTQAGLRPLDMDRLTRDHVTELYATK
jgi:FkbM family methyltransferase